MGSERLCKVYNGTLHHFNLDPSTHGASFATRGGLATLFFFPPSFFPPLLSWCETACKARGFNLKVHFKKTLETANALRGRKLKDAQRYLTNVLAMKEAIPFRICNGGSGRHAQAKGQNTSQVGWPRKSAQFLLDLLRNAQANAEKKSLDVEALQITHIQVNQAPKQRRRTYRAHGRIGPYQSSPCHVEMVLEEEEGAVARPVGGEKAKKKISKKKERRAVQEQGMPDVD